MPFDVSRHRAASFKLESADDKSARGNLRKTLAFAISKIVKSNPLRPSVQSEEFSEQTLRSRDIRELRRILTALPIAQIEEGYLALPESMPVKFRLAQEWYESKLNTTLFHLSDNNAMGVIRELRRAWMMLANFGSLIHSTPEERHGRVIRAPKSSVKHEEDKMALEALLSSKRQLKEALNAHNSFLRNNYPELDLRALADEAEQRFAAWSQSLPR